MLIEAVDLAYLAGLLDADGSISLNKKERINKKKSNVITYWPCVQLSQKELSAIDWIAESEGRSIYSGHPNSPLAQPETIMHKIMWQGESAIGLIERILPFLRIKAMQASTVAEYWEKRKQLSPEMKELYCQQVRGLNGRRFKGE